MLTQAQLDKFQADGFLVMEDFASPEEVRQLKERGEELVEGFDPESISIFSTKNQTKRSDQYFLDSAGKVSFFFEEKAFDDEGRLTIDKNRAINKIGHAMHDLDPVFRRWTRSPKVAALMAALGFARPLPVQSMLIFKQPFVGGEVVPHQDSAFLATEPYSCVGIWLALEDASRTNGCLWALPGSHVDGVHRRFLRAADGSVSFTGDAADMPAFDEARFMPVEVKAGSLVLLHGANVHLSKENSSPLSRHAYAVHFVEGAPGFDWQADNWLQRPADMPFEPLLPEQAAAAPAAAPAAAAAARQPAYAHARGSAQRVAAARPAAAPAAGAARSARPY